LPGVIYVKRNGSQENVGDGASQTPEAGGVMEHKLAES